MEDLKALFYKPEGWGIIPNNSSSISTGHFIPANQPPVDSYSRFLVGIDLAIEKNDTVIIAVGKKDGNTLFYPINQLSQEEFQQLVEKISKYYNNNSI